MRENADILDDARPTLATILKQRSYRTAAFVGSQVLARSHDLHRGFDRYDDVIPWSSAQPDASPRRSADVIVDRALRWIEATGTTWFFAWLHFYDAHAPYDPPAPFDRMYPRRPYEASIAFVDSQMGRLRTYLDEHGLTDRTVFVVVGDHGEGLSEHGERMHGLFVYQSVLHVPFIIRAPIAGFQGKRVETAVSSVDMMPTVLDCLGIAVSRGIDGKSRWDEPSGSLGSRKPPRRLHG